MEDLTFCHIETPSNFTSKISWQHWFRCLETQSKRNQNINKNKNVAIFFFLVKNQLLQFSTPNTKENKTMASPRVVEFLLFWLPAIHHITFEHHVVISNDVRCFLDGIFKGEHWNFQTTFWREHHPRVCVHDATTPAGNDDIIKIADDQEDEDSTRRRPRIEWNYSRKNYRSFRNLPSNWRRWPLFWRTEEFAF